MTTPDTMSMDIEAEALLDETFEEATGSTRGQLLKRMAISGGALAVGGSLLAPMGAMAATDSRNSPRHDIEILNFALTLEFLEAAYYREGRNSGRLNAVNQSFCNVVYAHEAVHVNAIRATIKALGGTPVSSPKFNFRGLNKSNRWFRQTSLALEETGVPAYLGTVQQVFNPDVLVAAARIATVEARHATWMRTIMGLSPVPEAFDARRTIEATLQAVKQTRFIVG